MELNDILQTGLGIGITAPPRERADANLSPEQQDDLLVYKDNQERLVTDPQSLSSEELEWQDAQDASYEASGSDATGEDIRPTTTRELSTGEAILAGVTDIVNPIKSPVTKGVLSAAKDLGVTIGLIDENPAYEVDEDDNSMMQVFNDLRHSGKYNSDDAIKEYMANNLGWNPARMDQLLEPRDGRKSAYYDKYNGDVLYDQVINSIQKSWYGGKEFLGMDLDKEDKDSLAKSRNVVAVGRDVGNIITYAAESLPDMVAGYKMFSAIKSMGSLGTMSAAVVNALYQGTLTGAAVTGENGNRSEATLWASAIGGLSGVLTIIPAIGPAMAKVVEDRGMEYIKTLGETDQSIRESIEALSAVEDLSGLSYNQKAILAVGKMNGQAIDDIITVVKSSPDARMNFIRTMEKKEKFASMQKTSEGYKHFNKSPSKDWGNIYDRLIKDSEDIYKGVYTGISHEAGKIKLPSKDLVFDDDVYKISDEMLTKWLPSDIETYRKLQKGEEIGFDELLNLRRALSQQGTMLGEEGATQASKMFIKAAKYIDNQAVPKLLDEHALPHQALEIAKAHQDSVEGYALAQQVKRNIIGKALDEHLEDKALQKVIRKALVAKRASTDTVSMEDLFKLVDKSSPKLRPRLEQLVIKDLVASSKSGVTTANSFEAVDWTKVYRDLEKIDASLFKSPEGRSTYSAMKQIAKVSQTDKKILSGVYGNQDLTSFDTMAKTALGFNMKIVLGRMGITWANKFVSNPSAFRSILKEGMEIKGSNLSEVILSMKYAGMVPKNKTALDAFNKTIKEMGRLQAMQNEEHNFKYLRNIRDQNGDNTAQSLIDVAEGIRNKKLVVNEGDIVPVNTGNKDYAFVMGDQMKVKNLVKLSKLKAGEFLRLSEMVEAPQLFKHYPELTRIKVYPTNAAMKANPNLGGQASVSAESIWLNLSKESTSKEYVYNLMHEIAHNINDTVGVTSAAGSKNTRRILDRSASKEQFAENAGVPELSDIPSDELALGAYRGQIDEQWAEVSAGRLDNVDFTKMNSSEWLTKENAYLLNHNLGDLIQDSVEQNVKATRINITQKMERLLDELPQDRKMTSQQLKGWLQKQGVTEHELEMSGLNYMTDPAQGMTRGSQSIEGWRSYIDKLFSNRHKVNRTTRTVEDDKGMYENISYRKGGETDPNFMAESQAIGIASADAKSRRAPITHQVAGQAEPGQAELGHRRVGVQTVAGEKATVLHEIQSDWAQQSRQRGTPFKKEVQEYANNRKKLKTNIPPEEKKKLVARNLELEGKYPDVTMGDMLKSNDEVPYSESDLFDWSDTTIAGRPAVKNELSGETWVKSSDDTKWEIAHVDGESADPEKLKRMYPDIDIYSRNDGIVDYPTTQKKYTQWQVAETINTAIENGTNRVVIPIDRHFNDLLGTKGVTKAYENMEKPIKELVKKLQKQGMDIEFNRIIDKGKDFSKYSIPERAKPGINLAKSIKSVVEVPTPKIDKIIDEVTEIPNSGKELNDIVKKGLEDFKLELVDSYGYSKRFADKQVENIILDLDLDIDLDIIQSEISDRRLYEIKIKGKKPGSTQNIDMFKLLGTTGGVAGAASMKNNKEQ